MIQFHCPDCHAVHDRPPSASFVIAVRCAPCELAADIDEGRGLAFDFHLAA